MANRARRAGVGKGVFRMSLEVNKAFAAVLTAGVCFMTAGLIGELLIHPKRPATPAIAISGAQPRQAAAPAAPAAPAVEPIGPLLAAANVDNGRTLAQRQCGSCHTFNEGGRHGVGPNLWGIVGANHARAEGFRYSAAIQAKASEPWTYEALNAFIANPRAAMPGTTMGFNGLANPQQRADVIAFLRTLSANPVPLP
jgi:cytochrome c